MLGLFSYYSQWIPKFSDKIRPLITANSFPLDPESIKTFENFKEEIEKALLHSVDEKIPLVVETDASDTAIAATLNQAGRPVAFFSRTLTTTEQKHSSVEKEACAIVESVKKWSHYLSARRFVIVTDQQAVNFMFDARRHGKIKNSKIERWRMELGCYEYDIMYRPGKNNIPADTLSRAQCNALNSMGRLHEIHENLCHPGITRLAHFVKVRNLPYSIEDVKRVCTACAVCARWKPRFYTPEAGRLVKATQPMERLSIDFKGPLPSTSKNRYLLTVIDEYSRFPFAFACTSTNTDSVIQSLTQIFIVFGMPSYIHSDRGTSFLSKEVREYLTNLGIATSRTTPYHPQGNGQCERYNGIIWKHTLLALASRNLRESQWETVLPEVLHSIRSLLCTATNATPHERLFSYQRRTPSGHSLPTWLSTPGPVLLRRHVRTSKYELLVDEVELLEANPQYAHIKFTNGRESTVSVSDLAPARNILQSKDVLNDNIQEELKDSTDTNENPKEKEVDGNDSQTSVNPEIVSSPSDLSITRPHVMLRTPDIPRRSQREIRKPKRYEEL